MQRYIAILFIFFTFLPLQVDANSVLRTGDKIDVDTDQVVEGDYYVSVGPFGTTVMSGLVTEDMYAFGGSVTTNGIVEGDFGAIAGAAFMHASVTDDVRIIAGEAIVEDHIGGDLFVLGGVLKVLSSASIDGDVIFYGGNAEINGSIGGSIYGSSENLRVDATVGGDIDVSVVGSFTLGSKSDVAGNVRYDSFGDVQRAQDAVIAGEIHKTEQPSVDTKTVVRNMLTPLFVSLFAALSLYLLFKPQMQLLVVNVHKSFVKCGLAGLGVLLAAPFLSIMLMVTVLGFLVGLLLLGLTVVLYALGFSLASVVFGAYLTQLYTKKLEVTLPSVIIGAVAFNVLAFIPFLGPVLMFSILTLTVGGCAFAIYTRIV